MNDIKEVQALWKDEPEAHKRLHEAFVDKVNQVPELKEHRDWVEQNIFGFGERSFLWMWYLLVKEMPAEFSFMEIGVFRGAILSAIRVISDMQGKKVDRFGVTPLDSTGDHWESDYRADIEKMHDQFETEKDYTIFEGLSTDEKIIQEASKNLYDILYIDGGHTKEVVQSDLKHYAPLVKPGGFLVVDDACNSFRIPHGMFPGIAPVTEAVDEVLPPRTPNEEWEFLFSIVHNRVYRKIK